MKYLCVRKCFYGGVLYNAGEVVEFPATEIVPRHFEPVEPLDKGKKTGGVGAVVRGKKGREITELLVDKKADGLNDREHGATV